MPDTDVTIFEVGPRDGLQNEKQHLALAEKVKLIELLVAAGLTSIEAGSFVSPRAVPQMADTGALLKQLPRPPGVRYSALVPNIKGMEAALEAQVDEVAIFASASESFSIYNISCSIEQSFKRFEPIMEIAKTLGIPVRGYLSCAFGCPYDGEVPIKSVVSVSRRLMELGCYEVAVSDTIGVSEPESTRRVMRAVSAEIGSNAIAGHFHDTYGHALENIRVCLERDITTFDSAIAGLGGCPYAPGASGNVATEALAGMLQNLGLQTGVRLPELAMACSYISEVLNRTNVGVTR